ncbi:efflux RND transporter periplasmic adaptor subunit [Alteraurantiacibacter aquimixticola]|uniref:Efflux RND transporter periplasmic adaptor subunit n=1 Tax=Alteraurantiacibacter aquimixticola TaxID=2489173 RepID=A0A4T3F027_9SPHN|nr:efflux RND transporter periplasmic adaptor subunit [Alteraurantiacibacter aquimixticola]TIX49204.1 efflux RND transporter periplasmic adaptor subunit [Alteraurantiacibacter aquimixticola]
MNYESRLDVAQPQEGELLQDDLTAEAAARRKRKLLIALGVAIAGIVIAAILLSGGEEEQPFGPQADGTTQRVTVISPGQGTYAGIINATGTLAARREMPVGVVGEGGRVVSVPVEPGDWVRAGQVLAVIDRSVQSQQTASSAAQIDVAVADADLAQANLDRAMQLVERGFVSQADIDRLTATRDAAVARVKVAEAQYAERQARNAQLNIVAPAAGLLLTRDVEPGQVVGAGSGVLFSIARGGEMELLAQIGETELGRIPVGATGSVVPVGTEQSFTCQVWQKSPVISEQTRQGVARCAMSYDPALRPGGFASIEINSGAVVAPRLPESAILSDEQGSYVLVVNDQDQVERRDVQLGIITDNGIVIDSGLDGSERIVARAGGFLTVGETVRPATADAS